MGQLIEEITIRYDHGFGIRLEEDLLKVSPRLKEAESELIALLVMGKQPEKMVLGECIKEVVKAAASIDDLEISWYSVDENGMESTTPESTLKWGRDQIVMDRFGYLSALKEKMSS
jgi:hypothetical protein